MDDIISARSQGERHNASGDGLRMLAGKTWDLDHLKTRETAARRRRCCEDVDSVPKRHELRADRIKYSLYTTI
jgi:hypothetical protein